MAIFSFKKNDSDEKRAASPPTPPAEGYTSEEGEAALEDDLHRGMKPRQLSAFAGSLGMPNANGHAPSQT